MWPFSGLGYIAEDMLKSLVFGFSLARTGHQMNEEL